MKNKYKRKIMLSGLFLWFALSTTATLLYQTGRNKLIFMQNGKPLSHGKIILIGSSNYDGQYTLDNNGTLNSGWVLFPEKQQYLYELEDSRDNNVINSVLTLPVQGIQTNDFYENKQVFTTTHFDLVLIENQTVIEQTNSL